MDGVSEGPWSGITRSSYPSADAYCASCLIDENVSGGRKVKERCKLPVYEPPAMGGRLNRRGVHAATERLLRSRGGVDAPQAMKVKAAQRLLQLYATLQERPPARLTALADAALESSLAL